MDLHTSILYDEMNAPVKLEKIFRIPRRKTSKIDVFFLRISEENLQQGFV